VLERLGCRYAPLAPGAHCQLVFVNRFDWPLTRALRAAVMRPVEIPTTQDETLVFERRIPASVEAVFQAFSDPRLRAEWGAPSDTAVILYDSADFRPGGVDHFRCGS
jgi:hypothetical protein